MSREYIYTEAYTHHNDPWGMEGVWPKELVDAAEVRWGRPVLQWGDCIVGIGPGWEPDTVFDEEWLKEACKRMQGWSRE